MSPVGRSQRGEKGQGRQRFHTSWKDIPPGFFIFRKGRAREKNDLSNAVLPRVLTRTKDALEGLFTGQLTNGKCDE